MIEPCLRRLWKEPVSPAGLFECKSSEERVVYKKLNSTETLIQRTPWRLLNKHMYYIGLDVQQLISKHQRYSSGGIISDALAAPWRSLASGVLLHGAAQLDVPPAKDHDELDRRVKTLVELNNDLRELSLCHSSTCYLPHQPRSGFLSIFGTTSAKKFLASICMSFRPFSSTRGESVSGGNSVGRSSHGKTATF
jgi:hypothetical protein